MGDLLRQGCQWLAQMRGAHCASQVTYRRGEAELVLSATFGRPDREVEDQFGVRIGATMTDFLVEAADYRLIADPVLLVDVLYVVCKEQADDANVTDEQFGRSMAGDAVDAATRAFLEELADFTPSPRDRARARKVIDATWKLIDRAQDVLDAKADGELARASDAALSALGGSSGNSPASSEPIPAS